MAKNFMSGPSTRISMVDGIRVNDQDAWSIFVDTYAPLILTYCRKQLLQQSDAEDVVQDAFIQVTKAIETFDSSAGTFRGWLRTIVERAVIRFKKKRLRAGLGKGGESDSLNDLLLETDGNDWDEQFDAYVFQVALTKVRDSTSEFKWSAFQAVWLDDESVEDVKARLKVKRDWLYQNKFQLLQRLSKEVKLLTEDFAPFHRPGRPRPLEDSSSI